MKLQWGLTSSEQGNTYSAFRGERDMKQASMGPHSSEQGNLGRHRRGVVNFGASMGPHSSEQGNDDSAANEETRTQLQWGLTLPSKETPLA